MSSQIDNVISIHLPPGFRNERRYTVTTLFETFLGLDVHIIEETEGNRYSIIYNRNRIIIPDAFFCGVTTGEYISKELIPATIEFYFDKRYGHSAFPVIYGKNRVKFSQSDGAIEIHCEIDIIASVFFMLSRWEDVALNEKDVHGRYRAENTLACRFDFIEEPVVNHYCEFIWGLLKKIGVPESLRLKRSYRVIPTHDIDTLVFWNKRKKIARMLLGDILKRRSPGMALMHLISYLQSKIDVKNDPGYLYDEFTNISDLYGTVSEFYFQAGKKTKYDNGYSLDTALFRTIIDTIKKSGHGLGFHPGYSTFTDKGLWKEQYSTLGRHIGKAPDKCRQHYLKADLMQTPVIWEDMGIKYDSSLAYAERAGFRCGVCYEFPIFSLSRHRTLGVTEMPTIFMDKTLLNYNRNTWEEVLQIAGNLAGKVRKVGGSFVLLWHNSDRANIPLYRQLMQILHDQDI